MVAFFFLFFLLLTNPVSPSSFPDRFTKSLSPFLLKKNKSQEYFELSVPLPSDQLAPSCTLPILQHSFGNTINSPPFNTTYSPPSDCPLPWSHVVLEFRAKCKGEQYDRISGLWLGGVELLRTSTAEPTQSGIFWKVHKDISRYYSLLIQSNLTVTVMLENIVNREYTGVYDVEVTFLFYKDIFANKDDVRLPSMSIIGNQNSGWKLGSETEKLYGNLGIGAEDPSDKIIPISDTGERGFWFRIESESDMRFKEIQIPNNTRRAVVEVYVSFHGNDEFWYSNPPTSYIITNNITTGRVNGAFREIVVTIDGQLVGSEVPLPVIFSGGINPLLWEPVVAIGAFNLPSYDIELTPFLGTLLDGKVHRIGIGVSDGISYWLVDANLHLWLDHNSPTVEAKSSSDQNPVFKIERTSTIRKLDGSFKIKAERRSHSVGWVKWSAGNFTTTMSQNYKFTNFIQFQKNGTYKVVKQKVKAHRDVKYANQLGQVIARRKFKGKYPLNMVIATLPGLDNGTQLLLTNVSHSLQEKYVHNEVKTQLTNSQVSYGWMEVKNHSVLSGVGNTNQSFVYRDELNCYSRSIAASHGNILSDDATFRCLSLAAL
ncbi:hypothetical protein FNV43_RR24461 [Rhamnella rubrinervis]|uniref:Peptide N-acetyl-beta-D-glucosaminyl asparaginase amidase A N-terminal domain-containing protein n=1 Tax=Rhamnella rubrinervis TaxID=2594499 RepID=A0A8K0GP47_9ROSA|nr:hypothetical protein FNV43_RR24461 [Rhamnella rubrinervis]